MALPGAFSYSKSWRNSEDFPTTEFSEAKVRDDMQCLFDEILTKLNTLLAAISAANIPFEATASIDAANAQAAIENVQAQIAGVVLDQVPDGSITSAKLSGDADDPTEPPAVTTEKIEDGAVTTDKLADNSINRDKIQPGEVTQSKLSELVWNAILKGTTAYQKPSGGIPKTDLASAVQTSLDKADSAVQSGAVGSVSNAMLSGGITAGKLAALSKLVLTGTGIYGSTTDRDSISNPETGRIFFVKV